MTTSLGPIQERREAAASGAPRYLDLIDGARAALRILEYEVRPQSVEGDEAIVLVDMVYHPVMMS